GVQRLHAAVRDDVRLVLDLLDALCLRLDVGPAGDQRLELAGAVDGEARVLLEEVEKAGLLGQEPSEHGALRMVGSSRVTLITRLCDSWVTRPKNRGNRADPAAIRRGGAGSGGRGGGRLGPPGRAADLPPGDEAVAEGRAQPGGQAARHHLRRREALGELRPL